MAEGAPPPADPAPPSDLYDTLAAVAAAPDEAPLSLTGRHYADAAWFAAERAGVLRRGWHCLGRADEIPAPGDFFTTRLLTEPLLVVRGDDGEVRVFANICRHRGMILAEGAGSAHRFVCRYHAWSYGRDGALASAPRMPKDQVAGCGLHRFRSEIWRGFVYATLADEAPPLAPHLAGLAAFIDLYDPEAMVVAHVEHEVWRCNWKALVENFMEAYHLSVVHPETLHPYTPTGLSRKGPAEAGFTSYVAHYPLEIPPRFTGAPGLSREERHQSRLFCVYPAQVASQSAGLLVSLSLNPVAVDETHVRWTLSARDGEFDAPGLAAAVDLWREVNGEDREKLEAMQTGLASVAATSGPLAPTDLEGTIRDFHSYLAAEG